MQVNKTLNNDTKLPETSSVGSKSMVDPAAEAGLAKVAFYRTDKWVVGEHEEGAYVVPKNTIPAPLEKAFKPSHTPNPVTEKIRYDRKQFGLDEYPDFEDPTGAKSLVAIRSYEMKTDIADVRFEKDTFVMRLWPLPKSGTYPFSKDDLLKAVDAAKWSLELFVLPQPRSDSDTE